MENTVKLLVELVVLFIAIDLFQRRRKMTIFYVRLSGGLIHIGSTEIDKR